jgi:hypothetical protein
MNKMNQWLLEVCIVVIPVGLLVWFITWSTFFSPFAVSYHKLTGHY